MGNNDVTRFYKQLVETKNEVQPDYGGNIMWALELYKALQSFEERKAFQDALEMMLKDPKEEIRSRAVEAITARINNQSKSFSKANPYGSPQSPSITGRPK